MSTANNQQITAPATPIHQNSSVAFSHDTDGGTGMQLARNPNSPSGQFGMPPVQMQAAPAVVQRKPSDEVPDLDEEVVKKINAALKTGDHQKALDLILNALVAKDPATFNKDFLVGKKLHTKGGGDSLAEIGPKMQTWLAGELKKGPEKIKKDEDACQKYLATLSVPKDMPDIKISIARARFKSAPVLYSVIRHEFIHFQQIRKNPLEYIPSGEWPAGYANPSKNTKGAIREVEAYLWEAENLKLTGAAADPQFVWNKFEMLNSKMSESTVTDAKPYKKRWKAALANLFKVSLGGFISQAEALIKKAGEAEMGDAALKELKAAFVYCEDLWGYRANFSAEAKLLEKRYKALEKYIEAAKASKAAAQFPAALAKAAKDFKGASSDYDGYNIWKPLLSEWKKLDAKSQTKLEKEYANVMVPIWKGAFKMLDDIMIKLHAKNKKDRNLVDLANAMNRMLQGAADSKIDAKTKAANQAILDKWIKLLGLH